MSFFVVGKIVLDRHIYLLVGLTSQMTNMPNVQQRQTSMGNFDDKRRWTLMANSRKPPQHFTVIWCSRPCAFATRVRKGETRDRQWGEGKIPQPLLELV